ncbi:hypothetical protein DSCW_45290 [Desulfosarcina widdelii]|uniref:Uncharacterized protein n=1 Tax=Desulfosarcina widdelii TaxID=947919 RepID=A0A5K7Z522_9BACT|nr:hypothetical protein DSCW_45290 [Desulfosarcina widdelii]
MHEDGLVKLQCPGTKQMRHPVNAYKKRRLPGWPVAEAIFNDPSQIKYTYS